jgi:hypothetical protein
MSNRVIWTDNLVATTEKKLYFGKFKSRGLDENHAVATGNWWEPSEHLLKDNRKPWHEADLNNV